MMILIMTTYSLQTMIKGLSEDIRFLVLVTLILKRLDSLAFLNLFLTQGDTIITRPRQNPWVTLSLLLKFLLELRSCAIRINECFFFFFCYPHNLCSSVF